MKRALWAVFFAALLALTAWSSSARAVPARELIERADLAETQGDHRAAAQAYEELVAAGIDSDEVLYDLGTVDAEAERYGRAIWCFEQVARRSTFALDARHNLRITRVRLARRDAARSGRAVVETQPGLGVQVGETLPRDVSVALVVLSELVLLGAWVARRRSHNELTRVATAVVMILAGLTSAFALTVLVARKTSAPAAIVLDDGLRLRQSARTDGIPDAVVREGERVELIGREGEFVRVRTLAGAAGWLKARELSPLSD